MMPCAHTATLRLGSAALEQDAAVAVTLRNVMH